MDYVSALLPPIVMAAFFIALVTVIVKSQGGSAGGTKDVRPFEVVRPFRCVSFRQ